MMKKFYILGWMLAAFVVFQGTASAKTVSGKIAGVDAAANKLSISTTDPASGSESKVDISVSATTAYSGAAALADLKAGQEVSVEASEDAAGGWSATSVKVAKAPSEAAAAAPAAKEPVT